MGHTDPALSNTPGERQAPQSNLGESEEDIRHRIGQLTRTLHDALRELGYDRGLMDARNNLPDARDRLKYVATMTEQAADGRPQDVQDLEGQDLERTVLEGSVGP